MKTGRFSLALVVLAGVVLLLATVMQGYAHESESDITAGYVIEGKVMTGDGYVLTGRTCQVEAAVRGTGYQLHGLTQLNPTNNGCYCTYMPTILRPQ